MATRKTKVIGRAGRFAALSGAAMAIAACAAVLGIDDRELIKDGGTSNVEAGDAPITPEASADREVMPDAPLSDGGFDSAIEIDASGKVCNPTACANSGGTCDPVTNSCRFNCNTMACGGQTLICPPGNDCIVDCNSPMSCLAVKCKGGRSCTLNCGGATGTCAGGASCESERCDFQCAADACKGAPIACDASVCTASCTGAKACEKGIEFKATDFCGITCSGSPSCNTTSRLRCDAPDASITCTNATNTCQTGKPQCGFAGPSGYCSVTCGNATSCGANYCCDGGTCLYEGAAAAALNKCP